MRQRFRLPPARVLLRSAGIVSLGLACWLLTPAVTAQQDIESLLARGVAPSMRWTVAVTATAGSSVHVSSPAMAEMEGGAVATVSRGANGAEIVIEGVDPVITGAIQAASEIPDEDRIDRTLKGDLPMSVTTPSTHRGFSAGSLFEEHSRLAPPDQRTMPVVAFSRSQLPLSAFALNRFIAPQMPRIEVADLSPLPPLPIVRPQSTTLVAANYPTRELSQQETFAAAEMVLSAYAPESSIVSQDAFAALFTTPKDKPTIPVAMVNPGDHWWAKLALPVTILDRAEQRCLAEAVYFEARSEPYKGQVAVAQVVLNRVKNPAYPDTICKVVYQNKALYNRCQFSFACDRIRDVVVPGVAWQTARKVASDISHNRVWLPEVGTATHYHATYVRPDWASVFKKKAKIGLHVFYQTRWGGWS